MRGVTVLGSTGSIGVSTLDVIRQHPDRYRAVALCANSNVARLEEQCCEFLPDYAVMADKPSALELEQRLNKRGLATEVLAGSEGLEVAAALPEVDFVMAAIVGAAGLMSALAAVRAGKRILLANKESLVVAGELFMREVETHGAEILPIDSEHNAVFQCMPSDFQQGLDRAGVTRILLTASGGPFRTKPLNELKAVTPAQACSHPNWSMGRKISVDSATMMNKGLEVIEACWLFHTRPEKVQVVVHPQSIIHSMVEYKDGSILAQLGNPDMRTPIAHAMAWPERIDSGVDSLDLFQVAQLDFEAPDLERFPCLRLAYEAIEAAGSAPAILNAANEVAVDAFLNDRMPFDGISALSEEVLARQSFTQSPALPELLETDAQARRLAEQLIVNWV